MNKQKSKRNHWVPQAYLKAFAADGARSKIWQFGIKGCDPQLKPIAKVAVRFYLYAPRENGSRDYALEHKLSNLEQLFGSPWWSQISTGYADLSDRTTRRGLSLIAATMYLRNPSALDHVHRLHRQIRSLVQTESEVPDLFEIGGKEYEIEKDSWPAYRDATEDDIKRLWLNSLSQAAWLAEMMLEMRWMIVVAEEPVFITSDNSVSFLHPSMRFRGLKNPDTTMIFPLSPTRLLCLDNRHKEPDSQYYAARGRGEAHNLLIWSNALEHMFAHRNPDEVSAELLADVQARGDI